MLRGSCRALLLSLGSLLLCTHVAGKGLVVGPARLELRLAPGEIQTPSLSVTNTDSVGQHYRLRPVDFTLTESGELTYETGRPSKFPAATWISVNPEEVDIAGGQATSVRIQVTAPSGASGTIWGGVLVSMPATGRAVGGFGVTTEPRVLVPVYVTLNGTEKPEAEIAAFQAVRDRQSVFHFRASLRNLGNTMLRPAGTWLLEENTPRGPIELLVVPFSGEPVLPGQTRRFEGEARGKVTGTDLAASVFFDYGTGKGQLVTATARVTSAEIAPARETRSVASGVIPTRGKDVGASAAHPIRISFEQRAIRLYAGEPIRYRSEVKTSPPGLDLELVGYRVGGPSVYRGRRFVERLEAREIRARPLTTLLEMRFKISVAAKISEDPMGLRILLEESRAPAQALASVVPSPVATPALNAAAAVSPVPTPTVLREARAVVVSPAPTPTVSREARASAAVSPVPTPTVLREARAAVVVSPVTTPTVSREARASVAVSPVPTPTVLREARASTAASPAPTPVLRGARTAVAVPAVPTPTVLREARAPVAGSPASSLPAGGQESLTGRAEEAGAGAARGYLVQVGAFAVSENANELRDRLKKAGFSVTQKPLVQAGRSLTIVTVGPFADRTTTDWARRKLASLGVEDIVVRPLP